MHLIPSPLTLLTLALLLPPSVTPTSPSRCIPLHDFAPTITSLQQTLALYPLAIDSKNFQNLNHVFAQNVVANYSAPLGVLDGVDAVMEVLEASLQPVMTQHMLGTFAVNELNVEEETAMTTTYFTASHFGVGNFTGQVLYAYGQYVDNWVVEGGSWKIARRQLNYMGPSIGNISIFT